MFEIAVNKEALIERRNEPLRISTVIVKILIICVARLFDLDGGDLTEVFNSLTTTKRGA